MKTMTVSGWKTGFQKVAFTELLKHELGFSLSAAKAATDGVLDSQPLEINISEAKFEGMLARLRELGAKVSTKDERDKRRKLSEEFELSKL
jgi:hypothetical protein